MCFDYFIAVDNNNSYIIIMEKNMKKIIMSFITVFLIFSCTSTPTQNETKKITNSLDYIRSGEYAFYLDNRSSETFFRGYMRLSTTDEKNLIMVRSLNLNTGKEERFMFGVTDDEYGYPTLINGIQGELSQESTIQAIPDFINFASLYLRSRNNYEIQSDVDDRWEDFTQVFSFNKVLPFFGFYDIKLKGDDKSQYTLEYGGFLQSSKVQDFYTMKPINRVPVVQRQVPDIPVEKAKQVEMNGVKLILDENWRYYNYPQLSGYLLSIGSIRDSQIAVEKVKYQVLGLTEKDYYLFFKFLIFQSSSAIEMNTVKVYKNKNGYALECYLSDKGLRNYQMAAIIKNRDDLLIVNFSSFADIFDNNREYFEKIFNSVSLK
jgi:hypothetical protein